jgi:hypothetical protein
MAGREIEVLAPVPEPPVKDGRLAKRDFRIDLDAGIVTCPAGHTARDAAPNSPGSGARSSRARPAAPAHCGRAAWGRAAPKGLLLAPNEVLLVACRPPRPPNPATAEHLRRTRPRIERLLGLLAVRYGARRSRYIGRAKAL